MLIFQSKKDSLTKGTHTSTCSSIKRNICCPAVDNSTHMYEDSIRKISYILTPELSDKDRTSYTGGDPQWNTHQKMQTYMSVLGSHLDSVFRMEHAWQKKLCKNSLIISVFPSISGQNYLTECCRLQWHCSGMWLASANPAAHRHGVRT